VDTRSAILKKALELFMTHGYECTSMRQIADALGITKPAIYHYFHGKTELAMCVVDFFGERMREWSQEYFSGADSFTAFLERFCAAIPIFSKVENLLLDQEYGGHFRLGFDDLMTALSRENPAVRARMASIFAETRKRISDLASIAILNGELPPGVEPDSFALLVCSAVEGLGLLHRFEPGIDLKSNSLAFFNYFQTMLGIDSKEEK
jgi:AcrR family transcriptional regulator